MCALWHQTQHTKHRLHSSTRRRRNAVSFITTEFKLCFITNGFKRAHGYDRIVVSSSVVSEQRCRNHRHHHQRRTYDFSREINETQKIQIHLRAEKDVEKQRNIARTKSSFGRVCLCAIPPFHNIREFVAAHSAHSSYTCTAYVHDGWSLVVAENIAVKIFCRLWHTLRRCV